MHEHGAICACMNMELVSIIYMTLNGTLVVDLPFQTHVFDFSLNL